MLDHPSQPDEAATVAERRAQVAASAGALRQRLAPDRLINDSAVHLQHVAGKAVRRAGTLMQRNPGAVALTIAGLAWLALGTRSGSRPADPHFEAVSRWEDEGGSPHPEHDTAVEETVPAGLARSEGAIASGLEQMTRAVQRYPFPLGMIAAALGGVLAARLPATQIERAVVADAKDTLRDEARRILDDGRERVEAAATGRKDGPRADLRQP